MNSRVEHTDVGAYALGLLDEPDRLAFESHLNGCRACRAELAGLAEVAVTLSGADLGPASRFRPPISVPDSGETAAITNLMQRRAVAQRRQRGRRVLVGAAAASVLIAGGIGVGAVSFGSSGGSGGGNTTIAAMVGEKVSATDTSSGATGTVAMESVAWGTKIGLRLSKVPGPETCELIAVRKDGSEHIVTGWSVPNTGYGLPTHPGPLIVQGGTDLSRDQIKSFDIRTSAGKTVLSIPV